MTCWKVQFEVTRIQNKYLLDLPVSTGSIRLQSLLIHPGHVNSLSKISPLLLLVQLWLPISCSNVMRLQYRCAFFLLITPPAVGVILLKNQSTLLNAIVISLTYLSTLTLSVVLYRLSPFHPLAKYPGPVINKISKLWMAWLARTGKQHLYIQQLHDYYGDVVRTGPNELFIRDVSAVTPIMGIDGLPKGPHWIGRVLNTSVQLLAGLQDLNEHAVRRKAWNRGFKGLGVQGSEVDLSKWFSWFTYDFMSDMAFGGGSEMMRDGDGDSIWHLLKTGMIPKERIKNGSQRRDLFHYLNNEDGAEKTPPSMTQVLSDGFLLLWQDQTPPQGPQCFVLMLLSNPEHISDSRQRSTTTRQCACILQSQAGASGGCPRVVAAEPQEHISFLRVQTSLFTFTPSTVTLGTSTRSPTASGRTAGSLPPGRESKTSGEAFVHNAAAFIPFSFGQANCVGKGLALQEMRMLVCLIMQRLEMRFPEGWNPRTYEDGLTDYFVMMGPALPVVVKRRSHVISV
ncbi:hypothetical protein A0H81_11383 [Grifola frondosa]|uniref:Cytochrome P450 n=1 Tax=Grifola frondosa TaxID=5627 RepID=A0A1C7LV80_GRIFR|nr:hypothetical protein A0H81_11383 [Grifola frondosa]